MRRSRCFVFDEQMKLRSSQNVKTKAYSYALYVYMSAQPLPIGASGMGLDDAKVIFFISYSSLFSRQNIVLLSDLTLLNINKSTYQLKLTAIEKA